jgi:hypothetical protein
MNFAATALEAMRHTVIERAQCDLSGSVRDATIESTHA